MSIDCTRPPLEYASEHERNFGGGLDEPHAKEQREPMLHKRRPDEDERRHRTYRYCTGKK